jgi:hypothetical protein
MDVKSFIILGPGNKALEPFFCYLSNQNWSTSAASQADVSFINILHL